MERLFIERLLVLYTGSIFGEDFIAETMERLLDKQVAQLRGLPVEMIKDIFRVLESWGERDYQLTVTYFEEEKQGPSYQLLFVDEMDSDPDVIEMRSMMKRAQKGGEG